MRIKIPRFAKTSAFQLALTYAVLFATSVIILFVFVFWSTVGYLERQTQATIEAEIQGLVEQFERRGLNGLVEVVAERVQRDQSGRSVYLFADRDLRPLAGNLARWPRGVSRSNDWFEFNLTRNGTTVPIRVRVLEVTSGLTLLVGRDIRELARIREVFLRSAALGIGITLVLALIGGAVVGNSSRRRIADINRSINHIIAGDLTERLSKIGGKDDYDTLIDNLNSMFDQIRGLVENVRHVGDGIAHDLRTPLARLRSRLELLSRSANGASIDDCLRETDELLATFAAILRISRLESGAYRQHFENTDISELVRNTCELYQALADDSGIELFFDVGNDVDAPIRMRADLELVAQAVANLIDNAIKYCGDPGRIHVEVIDVDNIVNIVVSDNGNGIPERDRDRVTDRFVRLDSAREKRGNGLGLAIVKAVAEQHDGAVSFADNAPGLRVTLTLRRAKMHE